MKINLLQIFLLFSFIIGAKNVNAKRMCEIKLSIPNSLNSKGFFITYDNGVSNYIIPDSFVNNRLEFHGTFFSAYATLTIKYAFNDSISFDNRYFIGTKTAEFNFLEIDSSNPVNPFSHCQMKNAIEIDKSKMAIKRSEYSKYSIDQMNIFWKKNATLIGKVDSVTKHFYHKLENVNKEDVQFIKKNKNSYFSFWWFRDEVVPVALTIYGDDSIQIQNLLVMLNTIFPKKITEQPEGQALIAKLKGRLAVKKNSIAPGFDTNDIYGNPIQLKNFKGKYVLLDFWATWCIPCMKQIPFLKKIRQEYSPGKLVMISISADVNYNYFNSVIKKNEMNWIHIFDNEDLPKIYGISAYPTLILIDDTGEIIYDGKSEKKETLIKLLRALQDGREF